MTSGVQNTGRDLRSRPIYLHCTNQQKEASVNPGAHFNQTQQEEVMLNILIIASNVANSPLVLNKEGRGSVSKLPDKLRTKVLELISILNEMGVSEIEYNNEGHFVLTRNSRNYAVVPCPDFLKGVSVTQLTETTQLLHWYLGEHMRAEHPGSLGSPVICCDCGFTQMRGEPFHEYCDFTACPSHAKWAEVIEGYKPLKPSQEGTSALAIQRALLDGTPNGWILKG